jgi:hypothetical protein
VEIRPEDIGIVCSSTNQDFFPDPKNFTGPDLPKKNLTQMCLHAITFGLRNGNKAISLEYNIFAHAVLEDEKYLIKKYVDSYESKMKTELQELQVVNQVMVLQPNGFVTTSREIIKKYPL